MPSFSVFFWGTFKVQPACVVLIRITFEHRACKRIRIVFPVCSQPVLLGVEFDGAPGFYIHGWFYVLEYVLDSWRSSTFDNKNRFHGNNASDNFLKGLVPKQKAWWIPQHEENEESQKWLIGERIRVYCHNWIIAKGFFYLKKRMYAIYKQTHPPTGIEHCVYCQFFSSAEKNLVVAGTTQLRIYRFYTQDEVGSLVNGPLMIWIFV